LPIRIVIVIGGPPNSGKSTFAVSLAYALQDQGIDAETEDLDPWSPTVDLVRGKISKSERDQLKKEKITAEHAIKAKRILKSASRKHQVVVADAPGLISDELRKIFTGTATHGVIVCREDMQDEVGRWTEFFGELKIELVAIVTSKIKGDEDVASDGLIKAVIVQLERKPRDSPAIRRFAVLLRAKLGI